MFALCQAKVKLEVLDLNSYQASGIASDHLHLERLFSFWGKRLPEKADVDYSLLYQLRSVSLDVELNYDSYGCTSTYSGIRRFLNKLYALEHLRLDLSGYDCLDKIDHFVVYLARYFKKQVSSSVRHFSLCGIEGTLGARTQDMLSLLRCLGRSGRPLESLELTGICLRHPDIANNPWETEILPALLQSGLVNTLQSVRFSRISQNDDGPLERTTMRTFGFMVPGAADDRLDTFYYCGPNMKEALAEALSLLRPNPAKRRPINSAVMGSGRRLPGKRECLFSPYLSLGYR